MKSFTVLTGCVGTASFKRDQPFRLDVAASLAISTSKTFPASVRIIHRLRFPHILFTGIYSVYQKCQHLFHPRLYKRIFLGLIDNLLSSPCSNAVFRIVQMHSKLGFSNSANWYDKSWRKPSNIVNLFVVCPSVRLCGTNFAQVFSFPSLHAVSDE
jgi:hypothetical protein